MRQHNIGKKHQQNDNEVRRPSDQQKSKYLLPKLKSYSQNNHNHSSFSQVELKWFAMKSKLLSGNINSNDHQRSLSHSKAEFNKLGLIKYHYVSKQVSSNNFRSPNYFKKHFKQSIESQNREQNERSQKQQHLSDLINNRVNNTVMKDNRSISVSTSVNDQLKSLKKLIDKNESLVDQKSSSKNRLIKSKAQFDKIRALIFSEKYSKTINTEHKDSSTSKNKNEKMPFQTLQYTNSSLYDTKYSNFEPNSIFTLKSQLKPLKKNSYQKLDLYRFQ